MSNDWTTPADLAAQTRRVWDDGRMLAAKVTDADLFPLALRLKRPNANDLAERFETVRPWIRALEASSKTQTGRGYDIVWEDINSRATGRNRVPRGVVISSETDALGLIDAAAQMQTFESIVQMTRGRAPALSDWLARKPHTALAHAGDWGRIVDVLDWFGTHPNCGLYLRQLDIAGIDTKFVEERRTLLGELLDIVLPAEAVNQDAASARSFEARFGLRDKPALIRLRVLDPKLSVSGLTDLTVPVLDLARFDTSCRRVFVTENEVNGLALPPAKDAIVIFGLGYAIDLLADITWLKGRALFYWGDIDTHGFVMLDRFRANFPDAVSMLMDRDTLLAHRNLWTNESSPVTSPLQRLSKAERGVYDDLRFDRLGSRVRLEQERIGFQLVERAVSAAAE